MAGLLPGVEFARRRRFHQSGGCLDSPSMASHNQSTRRSSFCLYASKHESLPSSSSNSLGLKWTATFREQRSMLYQAYPDENLAEAAREAKQRLDDKFRAQRMSENKRQNKKEKLKCVESNWTTILAGLHIEEYGLKKSGSSSSSSRRFNWMSKLGWKASEQEDCAVCLESFKVGDTLIHLPCAHRFHSRCLTPWLENNSHCPCCRTAIISSL